MPRPSYLVQRPAGFSFRLTVPSDLRPLVGLREVVRSIHVSTRREALAICRRAGLRGSLAFNKLRRMAKSNKTQKAPLDLKEYRRWLLAQIEQELEGFDRRTPGMTDAQRAAVDAWTDAELSEVELSPHQPRPEGDALAQGVLKDHGLSLDSLTSADALLARVEAMDAWADLLVLKSEAATTPARSYPMRAQILERRRQMVGASPSVAGGALPVEVVRQMHGLDVEAGRLPLSELFRLHREAHRDAWKNWPKRVSSEFLPLERMALEVIGDLPLERLSRTQIGSFADWIKQQQTTEKGWSSGTVGHWLNRLGAVLRWAHERNMIADLTAPLKFKAQQKRNAAYTAEELRLLFESPDYRGVGFGRASGFWLPLLGYFTGARLDELESAKADQIMQRDGMWFILLSPGGAETGKNILSRREVPLHPALVEAGLMDYLEVIRREGHARLFPDTSRASRDFQHYRHRVGIGSKEGEGRGDKTFHSFRATFITALQRAGYSGDLRRELSGHAPEDVNASTYAQGQLPLSQKLEAVQAIQPPFVVPKWHDTPAQRHARKTGRVRPRKRGKS